MICDRCSHWKCEEVGYEELVHLWDSIIGGTITPGHLRRYQKQAELMKAPLDSIRIGYKFCAAGILERFYLKRHKGDHKPVKDLRRCPRFTPYAGPDFSMTRDMHIICSKETHGQSDEKGIVFVPGLYENQSYMRIPMHGTTRPEVVKGKARCSTCGEVAHITIQVSIQKTFCCNEHYIEWWARRYREEYKALLTDAQSEGQLDLSITKL